MNWEVKYKTCRASFLEMSRINSRYKKEQVKEMQRKEQRIKDLEKALDQAKLEGMTSETVRKLVKDWSDEHFCVSLCHVCELVEDYHKEVQGLRGKE